MSKHSRWLLPLLCLALLTPFSAYLDILISSQFYNPETEKFAQSPFLQFVFDYAQLPAFLAAGIAGTLLVASFAFQNLKIHRPALTVAVLAMLIGPGLLINGILKPYWGRPRPRQIEQLGGAVAYAPYYQPNFSHPKGDKYKSFPSGHASMGFYFFVFLILGLRLNNRMLAFGGVVLAVLLGGVLSYTRIAQGGHFFTDVLFSALFAWLIAIILDWLFYEDADAKTV